MSDPLADLHGALAAAHSAVHSGERCSPEMHATILDAMAVSTAARLRASGVRVSEDAGLPPDGGLPWCRQTRRVDTYKPIKPDFCYEHRRSMDTCREEAAAWGGSRG